MPFYERLPASNFPVAQSQHPELEPGEVFLSNVTTYEEWRRIGWRTKRQGLHAYERGVLRSEMRPVFVKRAEMSASFSKFIFVNVGTANPPWDRM